MKEHEHHRPPVVRPAAMRFVISRAAPIAASATASGAARREVLVQILGARTDARGGRRFARIELAAPLYGNLL